MQYIATTARCHDLMSLSSAVGSAASAAKTLRNAPVNVTLLDRHNYHLFQPLLYQVATATLSPGDIAAPIRWIFRRSPNVRVLLGEVSAVDTKNRRVRL